MRPWCCRRRSCCALIYAGLPLRSPTRLRLVDLDQDYAQFVETAEPEALSAFQGLRSAVAVVDGIIALVVRNFAASSVAWPQIVKPAQVIDEFNGVEDAAWWVTPPGSSVGSWANALRDHRRVRESQRTIKPIHRGMRFSPWLRGGLQLNTPSQAREHVRAFAEPSRTTAPPRVWPPVGTSTRSGSAPRPPVTSSCSTMMGHVVRVV